MRFSFALVFLVAVCFLAAATKADHHCEYQQEIENPYADTYDSDACDDSQPDNDAVEENVYEPKMRKEVLKILTDGGGLKATAMRDDEEASVEEQLERAAQLRNKQRRAADRAGAIGSVLWLLAAGLAIVLLYLAGLVRRQP